MVQKHHKHFTPKFDSTSRKFAFFQRYCQSCRQSWMWREEALRGSEDSEFVRFLLARSEIYLFWKEDT